MEARAVRRLGRPSYPTRLEVLADPDLLRRYVPPTWKNCAEMAGAIAIMLTANNCLSQAQNPKPGTPGKAAVVAPIFERGEGRGATGCVVVNAPVFLSEQDAMQVIREELRKSGITLSEANVTLGEVSIPQNDERWSDNGGKINISTSATGKSKPLVLQGIDPQKKVGVEFVYYQDYFDLGGARSSSTVQGYDFKAVAKDVRERVASRGHNLYLGTFYDPTQGHDDFRREDPKFQAKLHSLYAEYEKIKDPSQKEAKQKEIDALYEQHLQPIKEESKRMLRIQVQDFIGWLKGQGVI